jgi:hypothetical protein
LNKPKSADATKRGKSALGRDLQRHVVQMGGNRHQRRRHAVIGIDLLDHVGPDAGQGMISDDLHAGARHRHAIAVGWIVQVDRRVDPARQIRRREREDDGSRDRQHADQPHIAKQQQHANARR